MSHHVFSPEDIESISTPSSVTPSVPCSPAAFYDARHGQQQGSAQTKPNTRRVLPLLEYPTSHEELDFCRDIRNDFVAYKRRSPHASPFEWQEKAIECLDYIEETFVDMCHIPPPAFIFYQWAYAQAHKADAAESGGDVFHLLYAHCQMFDDDLDNDIREIPLPTHDQIMTVTNLMGCPPTTFMLAYSLRAGLRKSAVDGRRIFWAVYRTLMDLVKSVPAEFLQEFFLDRTLEIMSTSRAQRGAFGGAAHTGVFPSFTEVEAAMEEYTNEVRVKAREGSVGTRSSAANSPAFRSPGASPAAFKSPGASPAG
ncbi:hypothetical protein SBRCBS47491_005097 [Sporothrix bragantina]|uniref:Uncharacterized protein n=1 Tax=Sporothrix bragantina TaxID=671064 RepID=A0ABP0BVN1_9PEZI